MQRAKGESVCGAAHADADGGPRPLAYTNVMRELYCCCVLGDFPRTPPHTGVLGRLELSRLCAGAWRCSDQCCVPNAQGIEGPTHAVCHPRVSVRPDSARCLSSSLGCYWAARCISVYIQGETRVTATNARMSFAYCCYSAISARSWTRPDAPHRPIFASMFRGKELRDNRECFVRMLTVLFCDISRTTYSCTAVGNPTYTVSLLRLYV